MNAWMNTGMDEWVDVMDGWMDGWMGESPGTGMVGIWPQLLAHLW